MNKQQIQTLAEYFTGPDLLLCTLAMASLDRSITNTAYWRARRFFELREAFGVPSSCDQTPECIVHIEHNQFIVARETFMCSVKGETCEQLSTTIGDPPLETGDL